MLNIFIGLDSRENIAWHVLAHSIIRRTKTPIALTPIGNECLPPSLWWRGRGPHDSTEFSNCRFLVPEMMDFKGWGIFMDCDMLCTVDINDLMYSADDKYAVIVKQHDYQPEAKTKFLGQEQTRYHRKNWSSLMLFNCGHWATRALTKEYVNTAPGLDLHGFKWCPDEAIGAIASDWNHLVKHA